MSKITSNFTKPNPFYVENKAVHLKIQEALAADGFAHLTGPLGCGKSQALRYYGRSVSGTPYQLLWQIRSGSSDIKELAKALKLNTKSQSTTADVCKALTALPHPFLLLIDGFANMAHVGEELGDITSLVNIEKKHHMIIATRSPKPSRFPTISVCFTPADALGFLGKAIPEATINEKDRKLLAEKLSNHPLALAHASICLTEAKQSVGEYLASTTSSKSFGSLPPKCWLREEYERDFTEAVAAALSSLPGPEEPPRGILEHLCLVSDQAVPWRAVRSLPAFARATEAVMLPLLDVGLVEEALGAKELSYCMSQPVASQLQWLTRVSPAVSSNWLAYLEEVFAAELTAADQRFSEQLALLPLAEAVVQAALSFLPPFSSSSSAPEKAEAQQFARRCRRMGSLAMSAKNSKMALKFFKNVHQIYTNLSLQNTIEMGEAHFLVGTAQATPAEAIASYKEALKIQEPILGSVHPVVAVTKYKIANSLRMQNKPDLSIAMYEDVASIQRQVSPPVPIDLAATLNNLGVMYLLKRAPDKALVLLKESLDLRIKTLGPQHLQLRDNLANLADCYKTLNRPADVLFYNCELLSLLRANICPEFKSEAATLCLSVAQTQRDLAMYQDAKASFEEARLRFSELPGDNMINISKSLHGIAQVCLSLGDDLRASEALNEELDVLSKASGNTSLEKNECKFLLGCIESSRGRHQEALVLLEESLSVKRSKVGSNDAGVASNQLLIAKSHLHLENTDLAKAALEDALRIMRLLKDPKINYAELSLTQYLLASIAFDEGKYTDALELFQGAVSARHKCHQGSVSAEIADALYGVAIAQCALRHNSSAQKTMEEVAALRKTLLGAEHEDSRTAAAMAATISSVASKFSEATVRS